MNETIKLLCEHRSVRSFTAEPISEDMLSQIVEAGYRGPTSMNSQQLSLVVVRDAAKRKRIAEIAGGQSWIAQAPVFITLILDMNKTRIGIEAAGSQQHAHESTEALISGSLDAGIALGNMMTAARALGLGIVPIGGIRRDPQAMIDLLKLPPLTFPVNGLTTGHIAKDSSVKPRLPIQSFRHEEVYDGSKLLDDIKAYEPILMDYWRKIGRPDSETWGPNTASAYSKIYYPNVHPVVKKQGFSNDK